MIKIKSQSGFTLTELVIAMAIFSGMMVIVSQGFLGIVKLQEAGVAERDTQQNARFAIEQITRDARTSSNDSIPSSGCLNLSTSSGQVYYYVNSVDNRLYRGFTSCAGAPTDQPVTSDKLKVVILSFSQETAAAPKSFHVSLQVGTADAVAGGTACTGAGSQFCARSDVDTSVTLRMK